MVVGRKQNNQYYISVEGETEKWYFERLQELINNSSEANYTVKFIIKVNKSPLSFVKTLPVFGKIKAFHICDYEENTEEYQKKFFNILDELKSAKNLKKNCIYKLGYSNFTFDLWIILHKINLFGPVTNRDNYLSYINQAYNETFSSMKDYKKEKNFKRIISKIQIHDVKQAIVRANIIRNNHVTNGDHISKYGKFEFYANNPDLTVHECVESILLECGLLP